MQDVAIQANNLRVVRGNQVILDDLSFAIAPGKITGLIGPSGSGKTTLMRATVGAQRITSGTLEVLGKPAGSKLLRSSIGYVTQSPAVYDDLTTRQNLLYFATILGHPKSEVTRVIKLVDLQPQTDQLVGSLSGGQKARVSLAIALLGEAQLLVLDEPTVGLDPVLRKHLWELFAQIAASGRSLLISSHVMDEAEMCPELLLLRDGRVLSHGSKQALLQHTHSKTVEAAFLRLVEGGSHAS
jgi:ABC-2 type transport system ATP-binding protein